MRKKPDLGLIITLIIFLFIFALRLPYIANSPAEMGDMWRQPDTESIARNFAEQRFNIFYPQFNYDGPLPNYIQLEFQVTTFIIAVLYKLFGHSYIIARLVPTVFFMFSALYLYLICRDIYDRQMAWIAVLIYGLIPLNLFYSRAIMPESALLFFFLGAYYHFAVLDRKHPPDAVGHIYSLAISQKTPRCSLALPCWGSVYKIQGPLKRGVLWTFAAVAVPPYLYIKWSEGISNLNS